MRPERIWVDEDEWEAGGLAVARHALDGYTAYLREDVAAARLAAVEAEVVQLRTAVGAALYVSDEPAGSCSRAAEQVRLMRAELSKVDPLSTPKGKEPDHA